MSPSIRLVSASLLVIAGSLTGFMPAISEFVITPAWAQEPLFLRIRPAGETSVGSGGAGPSDEEIARAARARSEAVWQRAEQRSRIAIASVCTGCLTAPRPAEPGPAPRAPVRPEAADIIPAAAEDPVATPVPSSQADAP